MMKSTQHEKDGKDMGWFKKQYMGSQVRLMGAGRWELWKDGVIKSLSDFVYIRPNQSWGGSPAVKTFDMLGVQSPLKQPKPASGTTTVRGITQKSRKMANGLRKPPSHILTESEIESLREDIREIGADESVFVFNMGEYTGYYDEKDIIYVRGDILPDLNSNNPRDKMSSRAVLAHEYYGHRAYRGTKLPKGAWNDEFRASYMAAKNAPGLTDEDRGRLIQDAISRAEGHSRRNIEYNKFMIEVLYGNFGDKEEIL